MKPEPKNAARRVLLIAATTALGLFGAGASARAAAPFSFQPIAIKRIALPSTVREAHWPAFTPDGRRSGRRQVGVAGRGGAAILFLSDDELWITSSHGRGTRCLSCGLANDPKSPGVPNLVSPFPDGRRVLFGGDFTPAPSAVLECAPSLANCRRRSITPIDFSNAVPADLRPGGVITTPQISYGSPFQARVAPDGKHIGFSEIRSDSISIMVVARLQRAGAKYVVTHPQVINPPAPTSPTDLRIGRWSDSSALVQFKAFTHGGADATYVQVGGPGLLNPDVWSVDLKTGQRTRLTAHPDWEEDNGISPDGRLLSVFSDRTMHYVDWLGGLIPARDFIDVAGAALSASTLNGSTCAGPMWLLPSSGDRGGTIGGQPIVVSRYPHVHATENLSAGAQWSPDGTQLVLNTVDDQTGRPTRYILTADLTARKAARAERVVSSEPGAWAPPPSAYHGTIGFNGTVVLQGPKGGTVTVDDEGAPGVLSGQWSETYKGYSDDGKSFLTGRVTIAGSPLAGTITMNLTLTGAHHGHGEASLTFGENGTTGHAESTYDGHTITGPTPQAAGPQYKGGPAAACPQALPDRPALRVRATQMRKGVVRVAVTAQIRGLGQSETRSDVEPVFHARVRVGRSSAYTDRRGVALVPAHGARRVRVSAGDTLQPTVARVRS